MPSSEETCRCSVTQKMDHEVETTVTPVESQLQDQTLAMDAFLPQHNQNQDRDFLNLRDLNFHGPVCVFEPRHMATFLRSRAARESEDFLVGPEGDDS